MRNIDNSLMNADAKSVQFERITSLINSKIHNVQVF